MASFASNSGTGARTQGAARDAFSAPTGFTGKAIASAARRQDGYIHEGEVNARREQAKRLVVVREVVTAMQDQELAPGMYNISLEPLDGKMNKAPLRDALRFRVKIGKQKGKVVVYSVKSRASTAVKKMRRLDGAKVGGQQLVVTTFDAEKALKEAEECNRRAKEKTSETQATARIITAFKAKKAIREEIDAYLSRTYSRGHSKQKFERILDDVNDAIIQVRRLEQAKSAKYDFRGKARKFLENSWPLPTIEAIDLMNKTTGESRERLIEVLTGYLEVEQANVGRGTLEYQMHEAVVDTVHGVEATLKLFKQTMGEGEREELDQKLIVVWVKLSRLCDTVLRMEKELREMRKRHADTMNELSRMRAATQKTDKDREALAYKKSKIAEQSMRTLCNLGEFRSAILNLIYETYVELEKQFKDEQTAHMLDPLERLFFELLHVEAEKENVFWEKIEREFDKCIDTPKVRREDKRKWDKTRSKIREYRQHLHDLAELEGDRKGVLKAINDASREHKNAVSDVEKRLRQKLLELQVIAPIEGEVLSSAYYGVKRHRRYKLGDWMHDARHYFTTEKLVEVMLRRAYSEGDATGRPEATLTLLGKPLSEHVDYFQACAEKLAILNAKIISACNELEGGNWLLMKQVERIGRLEAMPEDMALTRTSLDRLVDDGSSGRECAFKYKEENIGSDLRIEVLHESSGRMHTLTNLIVNSSIFSSDEVVGERADVEETALGERFNIENAVARAMRYYKAKTEQAAGEDRDKARAEKATGEDRDKARAEKATGEDRDEELMRLRAGCSKGDIGARYALVVYHLTETLAKHVKDEHDVKNPESPFYYAPYIEQQRLGGVVIIHKQTLCENLPKLVAKVTGEMGTVHLFFENAFPGEDADALEMRFQEFKERDAMHVMADELHVLLPFVVLNKIMGKEKNAR